MGILVLLSFCIKNHFIGKLLEWLRGKFAKLKPILNGVGSSPTFSIC
jgi:hypothetical protein